jgi:hypothetical protein
LTRLRHLLAVVLAAGLIAACGAGGDRVPALSRLPLARGLRVTTLLRSCNPGANAFCALQFVVVGSGYSSGVAMRHAETVLLRHRGWHKANAPVGQELAADSPGDKLRVTYATASDELQAVGLGWIKRPRRLTVALAHDIFARRSALAMVLQLGTT